MLRKILIANRGGIAMRIIRACAEMGICSVAIYSDADRFALHVKKADESYCIGSDPLAGYLNVYGIVATADDLQRNYRRVISEATAPIGDTVKGEPANPDEVLIEIIPA